MNLIPAKPLLAILLVASVTAGAYVVVSVEDPTDGFGCTSSLEIVADEEGVVENITDEGIGTRLNFAKPPSEIGASRVYVYASDERTDNERLHPEQSSVQVSVYVAEGETARFLFVDGSNNPVAEVGITSVLIPVSEEYRGECSDDPSQ